MATLFSLEVSDGTESVEFVQGVNHLVMDGGFDIGMPKKTRTLAEVRPGFFRLTSNLREYRTAKIEFSVRGDTTQSVINAIGKVERIINSIENDIYGDTTNGQLKYQWDDQNPIYFEVYAGDLQMPEDMLSVGQALKVIDGKHVVHGITLTLFMSPLGTGVPVGGGAYQEIPLLNPYVASKTTGGIKVMNTAASQYNYVEIAGADITSATPLATKIVVTGNNAATWTPWIKLFIGRHVPIPGITPMFPSTYFPISTELYNGVSHPHFSSQYLSDSNADEGYKVKYTPSQNDVITDVPIAGWSVGNSHIGSHVMFLHMMNAMALPYYSFSSEVEDYEHEFLVIEGDYVSLSGSGSYGRHVSVPLGLIKLPPYSTKIAKLGTIDPKLEIGTNMAYFASSGTLYSVELDFASILPATHGLRVLSYRFTSYNGSQWPYNNNDFSHVDDGRAGIYYSTDGTKVWQSFFGIGGPTVLTPNKTQRLYFSSLGFGGSSGTSKKERDRELKVQVYAVPTFQTLAF